MKTIVVIPAYQAAPFVGDVINRTLSFAQDILVVDDGSTDGTCEAAEKAGARVECHLTNRGKGAALKTGFKYALKNGFDQVITFDADGQHDPAQIPSFFNRFERTGADLIIGSRAGNRGGMPWQRRCSNYLTSHVLSYLLKEKIEDLQSGYRLISTFLLKSIILVCDHYELETEMVIKAIQRGFKVEYVPMRVRYDRKIPTSVRGWIDTFRWLHMVMEMV